MNKKVLVIDDNPAIRKSVGRLFYDEEENEDIEFIEASNGQEALDILNNTQIDLILLDDIMPVMDGMAFLKNQDSSKSAIPIVMITESLSDNDKKTALNKGVLTVFEKRTLPIHDLRKIVLRNLKLK